MKESGENLAEVVHDNNIGYLVYATLLPTTTTTTAFKKHTNLVLGATNNSPTTVGFNESFTTTEFSLDTLKKATLCLHVLSRFGTDYDPIVIGEIRTPLSGLGVGSRVECCEKMGEIETELEIETVCFLRR